MDNSTANIICAGFIGGLITLFIWIRIWLIDNEKQQRKRILKTITSYSIRLFYLPDGTARIDLDPARTEELLRELLQELKKQLKGKEIDIAQYCYEALPPDKAHRLLWELAYRHEELGGTIEIKSENPVYQKLLEDVLRRHDAKKR